MASTYQDKNLNTNANSASGSVGTSLAKSITTGNAGASVSMGSAAPQAGGNKPNYQEQIGAAMSASKPYDPTTSDSYTQAQSYLQQVIAEKPGSYRGKYTGQLDQLYEQIMGRGPYRYDMNGDALYKNYQQRYMAAGNQAMRNQQANIAAQSGGYGSSYAQTAGQQAYNEYVQKLNDVVPELQQQGLQRYQDEGNRMMQLYDIASSADQRDYGRYRDTVGDWQDERAWAAEREATQYDRGYQQHQAAQSIGTTVAGWERDDRNADQEQARAQIMQWMEAGVQPSRTQIEAAGMDYDQVMQYWEKVK